MPEDQVILPQQQTRRQSLGEELRRERLGIEAELKEMTGTASLQNAASRNPMLLDPGHDGEISSILPKGIRAFTEGKGITNATNFEKLEALVFAMRDKEYFGFKYNPNSQGNPKTAEETYTAREGDCDELSRVFVVLANRMGITDFTQLYVNFREKKTGEEYGHAALFYVEGKVMYIDPAFNRVFSFNKKFSSPEQVIKDIAFRKTLENMREEVTGRKGSWEIDEIEITKGSSASAALYFFEYGMEKSNNADWKEALDSLQIATHQGITNSIVLFGIGQAYLQLGQYEEAIRYLEEAIKLKSKSHYYSFLGAAYFNSDRADKYERASEAFRIQRKFDPKNLQATYEFGVSSYNAAEDALGKKDYDKAIFFYGEAERAMLQIISLKTDEFLEEAKQFLVYSRSKRIEAERLLKNH